MFSLSAKKAVLLGFLVLGAAISVDRPQAESADVKRYPASMCTQFAGPGSFLYFSSMVAYGLPYQAEPRHVLPGACPPPIAGGCPRCADVPACRNDPAFSTRIDCPIPKSFPDKGIQDVTVDVIDRHDVLDVECYLTSALWDPSVNGFKTNFQRLTTAGSGNSIQPLRFAPLLPVGPASHWYISCTLPANSAIVSYFVQETE